MSDYQLVDHHGNKIKRTPKPKRKQLRDLEASYDVLENIADDDHWAYAYSQNSAALDTPSRRQKLRDMAHYEVRTNAYARGIVLKQVNETIRTGAKLEIQPENGKSELARELERRWCDYCCEIGLVKKLRTALFERAVGGESFCVFRANPGISTVPVDFEVYEGDQFATPFYISDLYRQQEYPPVDGMQFDRYGNISQYHRLKYHPNGIFPGATTFADVDRVSPEVCVHLFRKERPSQYRGVSELAPCLAPLGKLRRYTEATLRSAEKQARILGAIKTTMGINDCAEFDGPIEIEIAGEYFPTLPEGWGLHGFDNSQPAQGYSEFKQEILHEIFSAFLIPWNLGSGDSSDYNFASGQLDFRLFYNVIDVLREELQKNLLDRFFRFWLEFANLSNIIPAGLGPFTHKWYWDTREPIDPAKQANADKIAKDSGLIDYAEYHQRVHGVNEQDAQEARIRYEIREMKLRREIAKSEGVELPEDIMVKQELARSRTGRVQKDGDGDGVVNEPEGGS